MESKSDSDVLVFNPSLLLRIDWEVRRAGQPVSAFAMRIPEDLVLVRWLLDRMGDAHGPLFGHREIELNEDVLKAALSKGILVTQDQVPTNTPRFACRVEPGLLELVPSDDLEAVPTMLQHAGQLVLNPHHFVQRADNDIMPASIVTDERLWAHLGPTFQMQAAALTAVPQGLRRLEKPVQRLWVEHPTTRIMQPFDLGRPCGFDLPGLANGRLDHERIGPDLMMPLVLGHILVPEIPGEAEMKRKAIINGLREELHRQRFAVIRGVVSPLQIAALRRHFRALRQGGYLRTDRTQTIGRRDGIYCEFVSVFLQHQLVQFLNDIVPSPIKPSFTWFYRYRDGAELERHTDREQCEWNVSFAVDFEPDQGREGAWPLNLEVEGVAHSVRLGMGDAVLYSGSDTPHWREPLNRGVSASMLFLHYVGDRFSDSLR